MMSDVAPPMAHSRPIASALADVGIRWPCTRATAYMIAISQPEASQKRREGAFDRSPPPRSPSAKSLEPS